MKFFDFHHHDSTKEFGIYNLTFGEEVPNNLFSAGIHPGSITENKDDALLWLREVVKNENCVAVGECGLDGLINVDIQLQEEVFEQQIILANEIKKPLIIHCVRKFSRLSYFKKFAKVPMVIHGYNKRKTVGENLQAQGFYLSFGKSVLYNVNLQDFLKEFPVERMFLETDSFDFELEELYQKAASLKKLEMTDLVQKIKENLQNLQISI